MDSINSFIQIPVAVAGSLASLMSILLFVHDFEKVGALAHRDQGLKSFRFPAHCYPLRGTSGHRNKT
jgi:hypothetical protein